MDEYLFTVLSIILLGVAGVVAFLYFVFLTRKRAASGYIHPKNKEKD